MITRECAKTRISAPVSAISSPYYWNLYTALPMALFFPKFPCTCAILWGQTEIEMINCSCVRYIGKTRWLTGWEWWGYRDSPWAGCHAWWDGHTYRSTIRPGRDCWDSESSVRYEARGLSLLPSILQRHVYLAHKKAAVKSPQWQLYHPKIVVCWVNYNQMNYVHGAHSG